MLLRSPLHYHNSRTKSFLGSCIKGRTVILSSGSQSNSRIDLLNRQSDWCFSCFSYRDSQKKSVNSIYFKTGDLNDLLIESLFSWSIVISVISIHLRWFLSYSLTVLLGEKVSSYQFLHLEDT